MHTNDSGEKVAAKPVDLRSLTPAQARVAIAKDVLEAIEAKRLIAMRGDYFLPENVRWQDDFYNGEARDMREFVLGEFAAKRRCKVCAIGACLVAVVARENDFMIGGETSARGQSRTAVRRLSQYFPQRMLALMEQAFEATTSKMPIA